MTGQGWIELRALAIGAALLLLASSASAFPIVFNGTSGYGVSGATASSVSAAGFAIIDNPEVYLADFYDLEIPAPDVLSSHIRANPSVSNPSTAQSRWSVTNGGEGDLDDAWLVFFTPLTYTDDRVGIDLQLGGQWALVELSIGKGGEFFYPAVFLGDVGADATVTFLMNHIVGERLTQVGQTLVLPQYSVGMLTGVSVPEPAVFVLLAAGLGLVGALRRGKV